MTMKARDQDDIEYFEKLCNYTLTDEDIYARYVKYGQTLKMD
jgi:hypothetical protein